MKIPNIYTLNILLNKKRLFFNSLIWNKLRENLYDESMCMRIVFKISRKCRLCTLDILLDKRRFLLYPYLKQTFKKILMVITNERPRFLSKNFITKTFASELLLDTTIAFFCVKLKPFLRLLIIVPRKYSRIPINSHLK